MPGGRLDAFVGIVMGSASVSSLLSDRPPFPWPAALERAASKSWESRLRTEEIKHLDAAHVSISILG